MASYAEFLFGLPIGFSFLLSHPEMSTHLLKKQQHPDGVRISEMGIQLLSNERCTRITNRTKKTFLTAFFAGPGPSFTITTSLKGLLKIEAFCSAHAEL